MDRSVNLQHTMHIKPNLIPGRISRDCLHISLNIRRRKEPVAVALLAPEDAGQADNGRVLIEWLVGTDSKTDKGIRERALGELAFYLLEKDEPYPWSYLLHHCGTYSNFQAFESGGMVWKIERPVLQSPDETHGHGIDSPDPPPMQ
jgi:hypothetical protein